MAPDRLWNETRKRKTTIKSLLLDQSVYAGIGNIYCDETLFASGVRPSRRAGKITRQECDLIARNVLNVLGRAIELGGSSISDFVAADGASGYFQIEHKVYGRAGQACVNCSTPISKGTVAQRGTHWCRKCQK
jgi:formamidopyrimidine-DNA glycosylase